MLQIALPIKGQVEIIGLPARSAEEADVAMAFAGQPFSHYLPQGPKASREHPQPRALARAPALISGGSSQLDHNLANVFRICKLAQGRVDLFKGVCQCRQRCNLPGR